MNKKLDERDEEQAKFRKLANWHKYYENLAKKYSDNKELKYKYERKALELNERIKNYLITHDVSALVLEEEKKNFGIDTNGIAEALAKVNSKKSLPTPLKDSFKRVLDKYAKVPIILDRHSNDPDGTVIENSKIKTKRPEPPSGTMIQD